VLILITLSDYVKVVYNPKTFIPHAASRRQAFAHCALFLVAAIRRCEDRVSVPLWGYALSRPLTVVVLVGHYPTNKLMVRKLLPWRVVTPFTHPSCDRRVYAVLTQISLGYSTPRGRFLRITQPFATVRYKSDRSTCMPKARRQRLPWARIKPSKSDEKHTKMHVSSKNAFRR
jgi:hypothetical protein